MGNLKGEKTQLPNAIPNPCICIYGFTYLFFFEGIFVALVGGAVGPFDSPGKDDLG